MPFLQQSEVFPTLKVKFSFTPAGIRTFKRDTVEQKDVQHCSYVFFIWSLTNPERRILKKTPISVFTWIGKSTYQNQLFDHSGEFLSIDLEKGISPTIPMVLRYSYQ